MTAAERIADVKRAIRHVFETNSQPEYGAPPYHDEEVLNILRDKFNDYWLETRRSNTIFGIASPDKKTMHVKASSVYKPILKELAAERNWRVIEVPIFRMPGQMRSRADWCWTTEGLTLSNTVQTRPSIPTVADGSISLVGTNEPMLAPRRPMVWFNELSIADEDLPF